MPSIINNAEAAEIAKEHGLSNTKQIRAAILAGWRVGARDALDQGIRVLQDCRKQSHL